MPPRRQRPDLLLAAPTFLAPAPDFKRIARAAPLFGDRSCLVKTGHDVCRARALDGQERGPVLHRNQINTAKEVLPNLGKGIPMFRFPDPVSQRFQVLLRAHEGRQFTCSRSFMAAPPVAPRGSVYPLCCGGTMFAGLAVSI